ncbi:MAG: hypothetical protein PHR38_05450 [Bacteroidales bacterium]|nr:hypothetical protein [Bacteroidales bacterium]MDD3907300.1 hypothetical protein [Bacteroidales bacterium]
MYDLNMQTGLNNFNKTDMNKIYLLIAAIAVLLVLTYCNIKSTDLNSALSLAGNNKKELGKVLEYYKDDSLKLEAARFLIENMPGSFSKNDSIVKICKPFYDQYDSLAKLYDYKMTTDRGKNIDDMWNKFSFCNAQMYELSNQYDIQHITAKYLISEIELAFKAWKENVYTNNCSFEDFCEYILPYRRMNGLVVDNSRKVFYNRHKGAFFTDKNKGMIEEADSLLSQYKYLNHSQFWGTKIPILNAPTFESLKYGLCEDRCWYNSLLFSSLGMAVAIDFVPAWGNRNNAHSWNVLIKDGKSYAFEPFWDKNRWKYKRIYNNTTFDSDWGRFRLAKVYRYTYKNFFDGPAFDKRVKKEDIPVFFSGSKKKDVSQEYFDTVNVILDLKKIPEKTYYAYLCVLNYNEWQPVQYGKIEKDKVQFNGMGKGVIYLPCYYKNGSIIYAEEPFLLNKSGKIESLKYQAKNTEDLYIKNYVGAPLHNGNMFNNAIISHTVITGSKKLNFNKHDTICTLPDSIEIYSQKTPSRSNHPVRYVHISLPHERFAFSDLSFYYRSAKKKEEKIENIRLLEPLDSTLNGEKTDYIFDDYISTGYEKSLKKKYIDIDLGAEYHISSVQYAPYLYAGLDKDTNFELFYWNKGWKSFGKHMGSKRHIVFQNVPKGALFILKHPDRNNAPGSRLFLYKRNEVFWY